MTDAVGESVTVTFTGASSNSAREYSGVTGTTTVSVTEANTADPRVRDGIGGSGARPKGARTESTRWQLSLLPERDVTLAITSGDTGAVTMGTTSLTFNTGQLQHCADGDGEPGG